MKSAFKMQLVKWLLSVLTDAGTRDKIRESVAYYANQNISGEEKRYRAKQAIAKYGTGLATFVLNLAIELAVSELKGFD